MSRRVIFAEGEFYHIYNRGTDKRIVFNSDYDYRRFQALLFACNSPRPVDLSILGPGSSIQDIFNIPRGEPIVDMCVYSLMPNHYHLLLREILPHGISQFMQKLSTAYTMYFNAANNRSGVLFQGKFKAKHADTTDYLKCLVSYIHINAISILQPDWKEIGIVNLQETKDFLSKYPYSSYMDYLGAQRLESAILNKEPIDELFESRHDLLTYMNEWISYPQKGRTF